MTWFLKNKIRKQMKLIQSLDQDLAKAMVKYNELVAEYQGQNFFQPINLGVQPVQNHEPVPEVEEPEKVVVKQVVTKGNKSKELPTVVEL
jgi:hypothetical protein